MEIHNTGREKEKQSIESGASLGIISFMILGGFFRTIFLLKLLYSFACEAFEEDGWMIRTTSVL